MGRDRNDDRDRHRHRSRSPGGHRARKRSRSRERRRDRNGSRDRHKQPRSDDGPAPAAASAEEEKRKARLEKLAAWRKQQEAQNGSAAPQPAAQPAKPAEAAAPQPAVWTPWDDPSTAFGGGASVAPPEIAVKQAIAAAHMAASKVVEDGDEDPLDAFMAAEVMPEVTAKESEEAQKRDEERQKRAQAMADGKPIPKLEAILEDSDSEEEPDATMEINANKVKLVVGPGGERIKLIQKKSKARLQIKKEDDELQRGFGTGPVLPKPPKRMGDGAAGEPKKVTIMIFGNAQECETAQRMIEEAVDNKEQKAKQRAKEYERKKEAKWRDRQLYHMRHTRDYEALGLPIGASRAEVKSAYRQLAKQWHPDKHPANQEEAKVKFQEIQRAYDSLMLTEEDAHIHSIAHKSEPAHAQPMPAA